MSYKQTYLSDFFNYTMSNKKKVPIKSKLKFKLPHNISLADSDDDFEISKNKNSVVPEKDKNNENKVVKPKKRSGSKVSSEGSPTKQPRNLQSEKPNGSLEKPRMKTSTSKPNKSETDKSNVENKKRGRSTAKKPLKPSEVPEVTQKSAPLETTPTKTVMMQLNSPKKNLEPTSCSKSLNLTLNTDSLAQKLSNISQETTQKSRNFNSLNVTQTLQSQSSTQDSEDFLRGLEDYIVEKGSANLPRNNLNDSQYSATTEEYSDFESIETPTRKLRTTFESKNLSIAINKGSTDTAVINKYVEKILEQEDNSQSEPSVTLITVQKIPINELNKSTTTSERKNKQNSSTNKQYLEINTSPTIKTRYSEENHQRLVANVDNIGKWVMEAFHKFLNPVLVKLFTELMDLNNLNYQAFCLRLYTRHDRWHVYEKICETLKMSDDLQERNLMLEFLVEKKFLTTDYSKEDIPTLLNYLSVPQIKQICSATKLGKTPIKKKELMISALVKSANTQLTLSPLKSSSQILRDRVKEKLGTCVMLSPNLRTILDQIHILFTLANPDLETPNDIYKLLNEIHFKKVMYPKFEVDQVDIFDNSQDFEQFITARNFRKDFEAEMLDKEAKEKCVLLCEKAYEKFLLALSDHDKTELDANKQVFLRRYSPTWVYCSVLSNGALNLTKTDPHLLCKWLNCLLNQKVYCPNRRGKWYAKLALVCQSHLKDIPKAIEAIVGGLNDNYVDEISKYDLVDRGSKIKKGKISEELFENLQNALFPINDKFPSRMFQAKIVHNNEPGRKKTFIRSTAKGTEYSSVEETAISFYLDEKIYTQGIHCEGSLLTVLLYLLFWDIIFKTKVPKTFISKIQRYPLDFYSNDFYKNRQPEIDARLFEIEEIWSIEELSEFVSTSLKENSSEFDVLINLDLRDSDFWITVIKCIGKKILSAVCERFVKNFGMFRAGLPDLFLWNPAKRKCCFVEVKSEKDRLSTKQILWLNYLQKVGAKVELCFMQDIGSRSVIKCLIPANDEDSD